MDINLSTLCYYDFMPKINTFAKPDALPVSAEGATFYTISNLFYIDLGYSITMREWVAYLKKQKQEFVLAVGTLKPNAPDNFCMRRCFGLFKLPVTVESFRARKRSAYMCEEHAPPRRDLF